MTRLRHKTQRGATLVECLIGLVLFSICFMPVIKLFFSGVQTSQEPWNRFLAARKAQDLIESIRVFRWDERGEAGTVPTGDATIGKEGNIIDDIDDWDEYSDTSENFTREVSVQFVSLQKIGDIHQLAPSGMPTDIKKVSVRITSLSGDSKTIDTVFCNSISR